ncbi:hypothetical protein HYW54_01635 [Candidatus Gottesmanbacteria bacterium]|nr:hypothetical protein [Candidatus Gottesmanbacteria bacterium]
MRKYSDKEKEIKRRSLLPIVLIIMVVVLAVVQMFILNSLATKGAKLTKTEKEVEKIAKENELFQAKVASSSSMTTIFARAKLLGLVNSPETRSLTSPLPVAQIDKVFN